MGTTVCPYLLIFSSETLSILCSISLKHFSKSKSALGQEATRGGYDKLPGVAASLSAKHTR
jgi:hypothetical protein